MIPFVDLKHIHDPLKGAFQNILDTCLNSSDFVTGKMVSKFEEEFAQYCQTKYSVGVSSGTAALFLALKALGIQEGDEVIIPAHTFIATAMAVSQCGATPIFVDVNESSWNINWKEIAPKINSKTKAIIVVHIYGNPVDIQQIVSESHQLDIPVIEDAAQAHGALYHNQKIGSIADIACFSFYPSKNLGALGEGGAVTTNHEKIATKISQLRDYGRSDKYEHDFVGYNLRLQGVQAGFLSVKLPHLDAWNNERIELMHLYKKELENTSIKFQSITPDSKSVYHLAVIQTEKREVLTHKLQEENIGFGIHYPIPCHQQEAYPKDHQLILPISEKLAETVVSLPLYIGMKKEYVLQVCETIKRSL
ncbi:MAG TPA: DegT/DnrJ/EryC1/StrS family aminotransferase [Chitinophagales bacterium]|nr:DegT/DnrJ/EryC1/StrS family aminotransferase [Chitinophagales bacterium]